MLHVKMQCASLIEWLWKTWQHLSFFVFWRRLQSSLVKDPDFLSVWQTNIQVQRLYRHVYYYDILYIYLLYMLTWNQTIAKRFLTFLNEINKLPTQDIRIRSSLETHLSTFGQVVRGRQERAIVMEREALVMVILGYVAGKWNNWLV